MNSQDSSKLTFGLFAAALGAIAGALSVLLARKESREYMREHGAKGLEYLNQTSAKLRERTEGILRKGREIMSGCCASADGPARARRMPSIGTSRSISADDLSLNGALARIRRAVGGISKSLHELAQSPVR